MKKRNLAAVGLAAVILAGCGMTMQVSAMNIVVNDNRARQNDESSTEDQTAAENTADESTEAESTGAESTADTEENFDVKGWLYENSIGDTLYFVTVKNNSQTTVSVSGNATAKDSAGAVLGAADLSIDIIGPGEETIGYFYFDDVSGAAKVDYQLSCNEDIYYEPVLGNLEVEKSLNETNVTITVTNNGDINAEFVEAYAFFMDANDNIIKYDNEYVIDNDSQIKPGASLSAQLNCYDTYDHVEIYLTGRSDGSSTPVSESILSEDFSSVGYLYETSVGDSLYFLVVTNNSSEACSVRGNAVARDASGKAIGAGDLTLDILGPGETSIGYFYFDKVFDIDTVDYQLFGSDSYYEPVLKDLSAEVTINDENVVVAVTNNGTNPAQFLEAYVLFFDADNNLVWYESGYLTDDDSELKPGATLSEQAGVNSEFDHAEVYFSGRYYE